MNPYTLAQLTRTAALALGLPFTLYCAASIATEKPQVHEAPTYAAYGLGTWQPCQGLPGCDFVLVRGNPTTGPSQWIFRLRAGTAFPKHWHPTPENMVGIRGILTFNFETGETYALRPGDFLHYVAGMAHWGQCERQQDCVFYAFNDEPYEIYAIE